MSVPFLQVAFRRIVKAAEMKGGGVHGKLTPHSVRHTAATWARRHGVPLDRIAAVLGHADVRMTLRTYVHVRPDDLATPLTVLADAEKRAPEGRTGGGTGNRERTVNETAPSAGAEESGSVSKAGR